MDFTILTDNTEKMKGSDKINKYLDLTRELKKKILKKAIEHEGDWYQS